ncbi:Transcription regulator lscL [Exophiala dermatitidis]
MFDVKLGCDEEARQVLQASLTDPPIQHAVLSLRALQEDLETPGDIPASVAQQTPSYDYGVQQYCMALRGIVSNLSSPGSKGLKSTLLCCQTFISIEQVRGNYAALAQHIIRGLRIMHEYRARPGFVAANILVPAHHDQLPLLDVFLIKLFAAPCKFTDPPATANQSRTTVPVFMISLPHQQLVKSRDHRTIAPNMRTELTRIAASTLELLDKISHVETAGKALRLLSEKAALLDSLETWLNDLERIQREIRPPGPELLSVSFMRLFHLILKVVLLGTLDSSPDLYDKLQIENDRLQGVANNSFRGAFSKTFRGDHHIEHSPQVRSPFAPQASPPRFLADSCATVCEVLEHAGIDRVVVMSTVGVGDSWVYLPWLSKVFMGWTNIKYALDDHGLVDKKIRLTKMDWTLVRASRLQFDDTRKKPTDTKTDIQTLGSKGEGVRMTDSVSVSSVARFLVKVAIEGLFIKSAVVVRD